MHIPFSMSDEPDLGDEFTRYAEDNHQGSYQWEASTETLVRMYTQDEVDDIIRKMSDKHQQTIDEYRKELVNLYHQLEVLS